MQRFSILGMTSNLLVGSMWTALVGVICLWVLGVPLPFKAEPEPITVLLSTLSPAVTAMFAFLRRRLTRQQEELEEERFSLSHALAYGYVDNYLMPTVMALLEQRSDAVIHVYIPKSLAAVDGPSKQRTLRLLQEKGFEARTLHLPSERGRGRDVIELVGADDKSVRYFDFPETLLTLRGMIAYKLEKTPAEEREAKSGQLERDYIQRFHQAASSRVREKSLGDQVRFISDNLDFSTTAKPEAAT